jgi:hypothetical protein
MAASQLSETATARDLLFGGQSLEPTDALAGALHERGALNTPVARYPGLRSLAEREVAREADRLLSADVFDLLVAGWKKYEALTDAARRTRDAQGTEEKVELATHQIKSSHTSTVQLFIDGKSAGTLEVELSVAFKIVAVRCVIKQARLTAIETGRCTVTGAVAVDGMEMVKRQRGIDLPGAVRLRGGVPLLAPRSETPTATHAAEPTGRTLASTAAWCADPTRRNEYRLWDGSRWTTRVANNGRESADPLPCGGQGDYCLDDGADARRDRTTDPTPLA